MNLKSYYCSALFPLLFSALSLDSKAQTEAFKTTAQRTIDYGYPVMEYTVQTQDLYILTMFRIPNSPKLPKEDGKPVIFLQHGLLSSSDSWILNGPDNAMAYLLVDAGFDVWLGNFRGNTYSRKHLTLSPDSAAFWDFSWHQIALYDLSAMIDFVLGVTGHSALHYVGHSQGTTTFMVLLSTIPTYNDKIKTSHMLAPVGYMNNMKSPLAKIASSVLGDSRSLNFWFGSSEFLPNSELLENLGKYACVDTSPIQSICNNVMFLIAGWGSKHLNTTLIPSILATHLAGSSSNQLIHYLQEYQSKRFRQYDYGWFFNWFHYGQCSPPDYEVENIKPRIPVQFYYSDNDYFAAVKDVHRLANRMGRNVRLYHVQYIDWNHIDFLWALEVKEEINDRVIALARSYEATLTEDETSKLF